MRLGRVWALLLCGCLLQGCASMAGYEKAKYRELERDLNQHGLPIMEEKDPILAGVLNLLPGIGNVYLEQWGPFVGNLLFWPLSPIWAVPQAVIDSYTINKKETLYFYEFGPGKQRLEAAKVAPPTPPAAAPSAP